MKKLYQDRDWLYKMYWIKKLSIFLIAKEIGVNEKTIGKWLQKLSIPIRPYTEAIHLARNNHCNLSQEAREWINGELLGDGSLISRSPYSARVSYSSKYPEYCQYVLKTLVSFGIEQSGKITERYHKENDYYSYRYQSRDYVELLSIRNRWYPEGKKIVPKDIKLTPLTLRQHYIGDGCLIHHRKEKPKERPYIHLCTYGFLISDVEWLVNELNKLGFKATRRNFDNVIRISTFSTQDFLNYIGECPVECYKYKWNIL